MSRKEVLTFLFRLSFLIPGKGYSKVELTETQRLLVNVLCMVGLLYQKKPTARMFYPSTMALHLGSVASLSKEDKESRGYIVIESNFKLFAYTTSNYQLKLLGMFCCLDLLLPNLVLGRITKEDTLRASKMGISVNAIIKYLTDYAHPRMREQEPVLPVNVVDQLRLWEAERFRLEWQKGFFLYDFNDHVEFHQIVNLLDTAEDDEPQHIRLADDTPPTTVNVFNLLLEILNHDTGAIPEALEEKLNAGVRDMIRLNLAKKDRYRRLFESSGLWNGYKFTRALTAEETEDLRMQIAQVHAHKDFKGSKKILHMDQNELVMVVSKQGFDMVRAQRKRQRR